MSIFDDIYSDSKGYAVIATDDFTTQRWFEWPKEADFMEKYVELREDEDVYFATTLFNAEERLSEYASVGWAVYADADTCAPTNFRLPPTLMNETSPGKWHCFWVLDQETPANELADLSRLISIAHRDQGCDTGWHQTKLLRVPGTTNNKYEVPFTVKESGTGITYTAEDIREAYKDVVVPDKSNFVDSAMPAEKDLPSLFVTADKIPDESYDLYADDPPEGASWYERLWRLELDLFRAGLTREEVFVLARQAKCNKYARDGRPDSALWGEVLKASVSETDEMIVEAEPPSKKVTKSNFLSDEEREWVDNNPGFVEEYTAWAKSRSPESAETYHRSLAFQLLSNVYGSWGCIAPKHGKQPLNLWVLVLGPTTATRKSTSVGYMLAATHAWEKILGEGQMIDIGSDFTAEGLNKTLGERDGLVSLAHRDEVHGFIEKMKTASFMTGTMQALTAMYDGNVQVSMRSTKDAGQKKRAKTIFNFLGLGIKESMGKVLTESDFQSGFLPRFVWSMADAPPWTAESEIIELMAGEVKKAGEDPYISGLCKHFQRVAARLGTDGQVIDPSPEALARLNKWKIDTAMFVRGRDNAATLDANRERMSWSIYKAAALLAMHDFSTTIEMKHLLPVLAQSEMWFDDMMSMAATVANSSFQAKLDEVEQFIISKENNRTTKAKILQKFGRKNDVDEYLENLISQGKVKKDPNNSQVIIALVVD